MAEESDAGATTASEADPVSVQLPESLGAWLDGQVADDPDRDRADVLRDLAAAYREVESESEDPDATAEADDLEAVHSRLRTQREEYVELVEDVRERVVDLRREMDDLAETAGSEREAVDATDGVDPDRVETVEDDLDRLGSRLESGFDNYETILEELADAVETLSERLDGLAGRLQGDDALDRLRRDANTHDVRSAVCGDCGTSLDLGLLTDAVCPRCQSRFVDLDPDSGLFGSPTLEVASPPALDAAEDATGGDTR